MKEKNHPIIDPTVAVPQSIFLKIASCFLKKH